MIAHARNIYCIAVIPVILASLLILPGCSHKPTDPIYKVAEKKYQTVENAVYEMNNSQVIFIGEHHDNPHHHMNQLQIIRELHEIAESPMAIGLEMFEKGDHEILDLWIAGELEPAEFIKVYYSNWGLPWPLYRDIFLYARDHQIPLIGLNIADKVVKKVAQQGYNSLSEKDLAQLPPGVTCNVSARYENFIERVYSWHDSKKDKLFANFCEAQVLWDTIMAINLLNFHETNPDLKIVILAGGGHSWKPGIPAQVAERKKIPMSVILMENRKLNRKNVEKEDADYLWLWQIL
jgi:uncharacterized iron-regulated protein